MKSFMGSASLTNLLLACLIGLVVYTWQRHVNMPWHGTVGTDLIEMKGEIKAAHKDIERIMRALDLGDGGGGK